MENVKDLVKKEKLDKDLNDNFIASCKNKEFVSLINSLKTSKKNLITNTSKLEDTVSELEHCKNCKGLYECKNHLNGHISYPKVIRNRLIFTYLPCKYQKELESTITNESILENVRMKDIKTSDKRQIKVIKWLDDFYSNYSKTKYQKGLYLYGNFGSGKTFLISALLHELHDKKKASILITYFPDLLRTLKEDFDAYAYKMQELIECDLLLIDDIGSEKVTEWGRDEVLGTILQNRMNKNKTTFFTSNLTLEELENRMSITTNGVDKVNSRRIMERVKYLTTTMELVSDNKRK